MEKSAAVHPTTITTAMMLGHQPIKICLESTLRERFHEMCGGAVQLRVVGSYSPIQRKTDRTKPGTTP